MHDLDQHSYLGATSTLEVIVTESPAHLCKARDEEMGIVSLP
jgi:hypothetical protein